MRAPLFLISLALSSAACSDGAEYAEQAGVEAVATAEAKAPAPAAEASELIDNADQDGGSREFAYRWPAQVSAIPALADQFAAERDKALAAQKADWLAGISQAPEGCVSCKSRGFEKSWEVVADLPNWLSLSAQFYEYTGGAHGMHGKQSLVWDRQAGAAMAGVDLFQSPVSLEQALGNALCDSLNAERRKRRGVAVQPGGDDIFDQCPGLDEATVFVGSTNGATFDRIGVYFGPYVAGAYAEGDYELTFPVTTSVLDAVKPEYASAFSVRR